MTVTQPISRFGVVEIEDSGIVSRFREKPKVNDWINMGYFVFEPVVFEYLSQDSVLEEGPLREIATREELRAFRHSGFWQPMDTYRESLLLNNMWDTG